MKTRTFGTSGIPASEVGFGLWTVSTGWWGEKTDEEAVAILRSTPGVPIFTTTPPSDAISQFACDGPRPPPARPEAVLPIPAARRSSGRTR